MIFDYSQYEQSSAATKLDIDNKIPEKYKPNVEELDSLLGKILNEWVRYCTRYGHDNPGIVILSGYRNEEVNQHVGGSSTSAHLRGFAADVVPVNKKYKEFFDDILEFISNGKYMFDEVIVEGITGMQWLHVGVRSFDGIQRMKTMRFNDGLLESVQLDNPNITLGSRISQEVSIEQPTDKHLDDENTHIDWSDEFIYNMSPEEIDSYENERQPSLFSRDMLTTSRSGMSPAEKRCIFIMKHLIEKLCLNEKQAAGIVGNIAYMTDGSFFTQKKSGKKFGICLWDESKRQMYNKTHHKSSVLEKSTLREQVDFLAYTMSDLMVTKFQKSYDSNESSNLFFSMYINNKSWSSMFVGVSRDQENKIRKEASDRRAFSNKVLDIWAAYSYIDVEDYGSYSGNGQDGPKIQKSFDPKTYVSDGEISPVPENEREFSREYLDDYEEDLEKEAYYSNLFASMMGL